MLDFAKEVQSSLPKLRTPEPQRSGTLVRLVGLTLETRGIMAPLGACCEVMGQGGHRVEAEVVGFNDKTLYLMPFTDPVGVGPGDTVRVMSNSGQVRLGNELLGRVIDGRGVPIDGKPMPHLPDQLSLLGCPLNPMERGPIEEVLDVGVKAINGALTIGRGQRIGLVAGSGVGKSVLLGMLTRFTKADIVVIGLIGERGREVQAFIHESLGEEGLAKSVVVAAPADAPPLFLIISDDDKSVSALSATKVYDMWHKAGSPAELHVFGNGGHGWGMLKDTGFLSDPWPMLLQNWLKFRGLL